MTRFAITGPTDLTENQERFIADTVLLQLQADEADPFEFTSGAAYGADTVGAMAAEHARVPLIRLTVPDAPHNASLTRYGTKQGWTLEDATPMTYQGRAAVPLHSGTYRMMAYMHRNDLTISHTDILLAFPETRLEERRSGTWATIRRARKAGCEIRGFPLDRSEGWIEPATRLVPQD